MSRWKNGRDKEMMMIMNFREIDMKVSDTVMRTTYSYLMFRMGDR